MDGAPLRSVRSNEDCVGPSGVDVDVRAIAATEAWSQASSRSLTKWSTHGRGDQICGLRASRLAWSDSS